MSFLLDEAKEGNERRSARDRCCSYVGVYAAFSFCTHSHLFLLACNPFFFLLLQLVLSIAFIIIFSISALFLRHIPTFYIHSLLLLHSAFCILSLALSLSHSARSCLCHLPVSLLSHAQTIIFPSLGFARVPPPPWPPSTTVVTCS